MKSIYHAISASIALTMIATFWMATVCAELLGTYTIIYRVKYLILFAMPVFIFFMVCTAITGNLLARGKSSSLINKKRKRMALAALNGIIILLPTAIYLEKLAAKTVFNHLFYTLQSIELVVGAMNITLLSMNMRDGLRLKKAYNRAKNNLQKS